MNVILSWGLVLESIGHHVVQDECTGPGKFASEGGDKSAPRKCLDGWKEEGGPFHPDKQQQQKRKLAADDLALLVYEPSTEGKGTKTRFRSLVSSAWTQLMSASRKSSSYSRSRPHGRDLP
ncbi:hypothetical protein PoB_000401900 [Plakobranchus ocellatus]|uniref:Uncharacterized protein n=1 Tax=Plakobranchus ocellatus TaxID=259542 RepID=A0AAV3Y5Z7_9GAST|nr:hypothetical protein PoB_000401900 [Plakobranchus ocellatus]